MTATIESVIAAAQQLTPREQLEVIQSLSRILLQQYTENISVESQSKPSIPSYIHRTQPVTSLAQLAADFWPDDETADDINNYITRQRTADRDKDMMNSEDFL
jgi:hypothetical protein